MRRELENDWESPKCADQDGGILEKNARSKRPEKIYDAMDGGVFGRSIEGDFVCTMDECKSKKIKHPKWIKRLGDREPLDDSIMRGRLLFRALATVPQFCARLKIVEKIEKSSVEKDREAFKEFLLYYDKIKNWLGKVVKTPVTSLVTERNEKYN